jgi:hypothetical protein
MDRFDSLDLMPICRADPVLGEKKGREELPPYSVECLDLCGAQGRTIALICRTVKWDIGSVRYLAMSVWHSPAGLTIESLGWGRRKPVSSLAPIEVFQGSASRTLSKVMA